LLKTTMESIHDDILQKNLSSLGLLLQWSVLARVTTGNILEINHSSPESPRNLCLSSRYHVWAGNGVQIL
jgi:hypothetical protein